MTAGSTQGEMAEDFPLAGGPETTTNPRKAATYQSSSAVGRSG